MHRSRWLAVVAVPLVMLSAEAQQHTDQLYTASRLQLDVTKVLIAEQNAWNHGDMDAYMGFYKDDPATTALLSAPVRGIENIRAAYRLNFPSAASMGTLEETEIEVRALGENYALATGKYRLNRSKKAGGELTGTFAEVLEKTAAGWRVVFSTNS